MFLMTLKNENILLQIIIYVDLGYAATPNSKFRYFQPIAINSLIVMLKSLIGKKVKTFNIINMIGQGQSGAVFEAFDESNSQLVAIKVMYLKKINLHQKFRQQVQTEISVLKNCSNPNVIKFIDSFEVNWFLFIVTEFCNGGSLDQQILTRQITQDQAVTYLQQIMNGFKGLHELGAIHRDFKLTNILLHDGVCKIADLGSSKQLGEQEMAKTIIGTPLINAPEVLARLPYGFEADIWSLGVVFYQMLYGRYPYCGENDSALLADIKSRRPDFSGFNISEKSKKFIQRCLTINPQQRIHWAQIYSDPLLVCQNQNRVLDNSFLTKRISLNKNRQFYENLNQLQLTRLEKTYSDINNTSIEILAQQEVLSLQNIDQLIAKTDSIKKQAQIKERFDNLYIGKRNDLMFFNQFIQPYIDGLPKIQVNYWVAGFLLAKKSYLQLSKLKDAIKNEKVIFYGEKGFEWYSKHENYQKLSSQISVDIACMWKACNQYKQMIKVTSLEIKNQFDITKTNCRFDNLVQEILAEYCRLLAEGIAIMKSPNEKEVLIRLIAALEYYNYNTKIYSQQFSRIISTANFQEIEKNMKNKYHIK